MAKKKTLFVSDIHLGAGRKGDWFNIEKEGPYLERFFAYIRERYTRDKDIKELVLLGDIFDMWVCNHDEEPHTFDDILNAQKGVIKAIRKTAEKVPTLYVNGNHDFRVSRENIEKAFKNKVKHIGSLYRRRNIRAEHGHNYALFNRPDPKNGGHSSLPLGYFISRLHSSLGMGRKGKANMLLQIFDEGFQMMGPEKMPESVLDAMKDAVENTTKKKVDSFNMGSFGPARSYDEIRERYKDLFEDWINAKGYWFATQMILCEMNRLGSIADYLCRDGVNVVVFGHSHDTKMDKDTWFVDDRIYANCGYWCGFGEAEKINDNAHFVETDGEAVTLCRFNDGDVQAVTTHKL